MIERLDPDLGCRVIAAALDGEGALAGVGEEIVWRERVHKGWVKELGAFQAGEGKNDGLEVAGFEFADAGVDVAADVVDFQVGADGQELTAAAEGACADFGSGRKIAERFGAGGDQDIADIFALRDSGDGKVGLLDQRHRHRHVFEAVDYEIDFVIEEGLFQLADEEPFAPQLVEGAIGDLIAGSFESCDGDIELWVEAIELVYDELGLSERERRAAGAQTQGCWSLTGHDADSSVRAQRKPSPLPSLRVLGEGVAGEASWLGQFL